MKNRGAFGFSTLIIGVALFWHLPYAKDNVAEIFIISTALVIISICVFLRK